MCHFFLRLLGLSRSETKHDPRMEKRLLSHCSLSSCFLPVQKRGSRRSDPGGGPEREQGPEDSKRTMPLIEIPDGMAEKRESLRFACDVIVACHTDVGGPGAHWVARALNVSCGGVELATERRFERGTILTIDVAKGEGHEFPNLMAQVVRVQGPVDGRWILGCRFVHDLSEYELLDFLGNPTPAEAGVLLPTGKP